MLVIKLPNIMHKEVQNLRSDYQEEGHWWFLKCLI